MHRRPSKPTHSPPCFFLRSGCVISSCVSSFFPPKQLHGQLRLSMGALSMFWRGCVAAGDYGSGAWRVVGGGCMGPSLSIRWARAKYVYEDPPTLMVDFVFGGFRGINWMETRLFVTLEYFAELFGFFSVYAVVASSRKSASLHGFSGLLTLLRGQKMVVYTQMREVQNKRAGMKVACSLLSCFWKISTSCRCFVSPC